MNITAVYSNELTNELLNKIAELTKEGFGDNAELMLKSIN